MLERGVAVRQGLRFLRIELPGILAKRTDVLSAAWVVLVRVGPKHWDRYGLKSWIEAAKKRLLIHSTTSSGVLLQAFAHEVDMISQVV